MKSRLIVAYCCLILCMCGCGYQFAPNEEGIDRQIQTVYIGNFANNTSQAQLENYLRSAFAEQIIQGNRFKLAAKETADAVLTGTIKSITISHVSYTSSDIAKEDRAIVTAGIRFTETRSQNIIWENGNIAERKTYRVESSTSITEANRKNALKALSRDLAEKAYRSMISGF